MVEISPWVVPWHLNVSVATPTFVSKTGLASRSSESGSDNLCITLPNDGEYFAPEFILLGAEKAGTTSFAAMFMTESSGQLTFPTSHNDPWVGNLVPKELHFFNIEWRFNQGKSFWLHHYPKCSRIGRMVATDLTPSYLVDKAVPERMSRYYGEHGSRVKFGVLLRDPLKRMQSAFYFWKHHFGRPLCESMYIDVSFQEYVQGILKGKDPCNVLTGGDYHEQLWGYFKWFKPTQFTIFLFGHIAKPPENRSSAISDLWQSLGLQGGPPPEVEHANSAGSSHPSLEKDLDPGTLTAIKAHINKTMGHHRLAGLLAGTKATLARYSGSGDESSVAQWLMNW